MSLGTLEREWQPFTPCPCGCGVVAGKLSMKTGHVIGCKCHSCIGLRNRRKGQKNQALSHRRLGGQGFTPTNEESARAYDVKVSIQPEHKTGEQVPKSFDKFVSTEWFRRALSQAERAIPTGSGALPAVTIRSQFCIIDIRGKPWPRAG